jgi:glyoxylase-like metal-dependent hydrolase (beta-lactamase superfamily II)
MHKNDRRQFLRSGAGALAGLTTLPLLGALAGCQGAPVRDGGGTARARRAALASQALGAQLKVISGVPGNVVALSGTDGVLLVDTGAADVAGSLQQHLGDATVRAVINTHHHLDQTGGNALFGAAGAKIHAQTITKQWLATDYWVPQEMRWEKAPPKQAVPTVTFRDKYELAFDGERIECGYLLEAHTRGDAYVFFRDSNVLATGDVVSPLRDPVHDWFAGGWLGGRVDALDDLLELANDATRIVPAYGAVMTKAELQAERDLMWKIFEKTAGLMSKGHSGKDMLEQGALDEFPRKFQDPGKFLYDISKGYQAHYTNVGANVV